MATTATTTTTATSGAVTSTASLVRTCPEVSSGATVPIWMKPVDNRQTYPKLQENLTCDVCVIGGGIAGLTAAYLLSREGKQVVVVEDGEIASGETGRTTAHLFNAMDDRFFNIEKNHGKDGARLVAESHTAAINQIEEIVKREQIECDFVRLPGYLFLGPPTHTKEGYLDKEFQAAKDAGLQVEMVESVPCSFWDSGPAIKFPGQGQFHPLKYCRGLARAIERNGGRIYCHTHASKMEGSDHREATTTTANGHVIKSNDIIVATNVPVNDRITMYSKMEMMRSYAISVNIPKGSVPLALFWDTYDPYHYVRLIPGYDEQHDMLIIGGEDHPTGQKHDFDERYNALYNWTKERFPMIQDVTARWSGQVVEPVDDIAFLGRNPGDYKNVFIITGDSGHGMTHTTIGAMMINDMIHGRANPWEKIYNPGRQMTDAVGEFVKYMAHTQLQYKDYITGSDVHDIEDIPLGCGAVMRSGLTKVAVYKDEHGMIHKCSAICPHLGGIVHWNSSEKSWDCPVHGSRFDPYGVVVNGPANKGLSGEPQEEPAHTK